NPAAGKYPTPFPAMARKPASIQRLLFPPDPDDASAPQSIASPHTKGDRHAVQNHLPPDDPGSSGELRPAPEQSETAADAEPLRHATEDLAPGLEGTAVAGEAGQHREPDRERGAGDSSQGTGGFFASRVSAERQRSPFPRRRDGLHPPSHSARVRAS